MFKYEYFNNNNTNKNKNNNNLFDFYNSEIQFCKINNNKFDKKNYNYVLIEIYNIIINKILENNSINDFFKNSYFNFKINKYEYCGYRWYENINLSVKEESINDTLNEIINMCNIYKINFEIIIKLNNSNLINYKINYKYDFNF